MKLLLLLGLAIVVGLGCSFLILLGTFQGVQDWFQEMWVASSLAGIVTALVAQRIGDRLLPSKHASASLS
jgi:hypothetical protein